jgi:hypothetical protein
MGGMWIFDPLTSLWSIPSGFSDIDDRGTGRWMHSMITTGGTVILNGGGGDNGAAPASLTTITLIPNVFPLYSFPFSAWPIQYTTNLVGDPRSCIIGIEWRFFVFCRSVGILNAYAYWVSHAPLPGSIPPSPINFSISQFVSMAPISLGSRTTSWSYTDGSEFSQFIPVGGKYPVYPNTSSWAVLNQLRGHRGILMGDSIYYIGGDTTIMPSKYPMIVSTFPSIKAIRAGINPVCNTTQLSCSAGKCGVFQIQPTSSNESCVLCVRGSRLMLVNDRPACRLCKYVSFKYKRFTCF